MQDCLFCNPSEDDIFYGTTTFYAMFDRFPVTPGAFLLIPREHTESIIDLSQEDAATIPEIIKEATEAMRKLDLNEIYTKFCENPINEKSLQFCKEALNHPNINKKMTQFNWGGNDGEAAGRTIHHLHIHIYPRYKNDCKDPRGGIRHMFPGKGNYKT